MNEHPLPTVEAKRGPSDIGLDHEGECVAPFDREVRSIAVAARNRF